MINDDDDIQDYVASSGWRKRQIALDIKAENARGLGLDYEPQNKPAPVQEPVSLRRGDILRCIETDELCTVWATSTTGKTLIKWSANNFGNYTAEQIGELFWLEPKHPEIKKPQNCGTGYCSCIECMMKPSPTDWLIEFENGQEPVGKFAKFTDGIWREVTDGSAGVPLYTAPPQRTWVGLTDGVMCDIAMEHGLMDINWIDFARAIEAKLRSKNT